jgi:hypothetical protein
VTTTWPESRRNAQVSLSSADEAGVPSPPSDFDPGTPGASARREGERRRANREQRIRERNPRLGGLRFALQEAPAHERAWENGAVGEEQVAASLARRCPEALVLHDRCLPGSRANIDHLAIAPSGVFVIDAKRYKGKIAVRRPLFGEPKLMIAGRNKAKLVDGLAQQVEVVLAELAEIAPGIAVQGCFCFVNPPGLLASSDLPLLRTLSIDGYPLFYPRKLVKRLNKPGPLGPDEAHRIASELAARFPAAC